MKYRPINPPSQCPLQVSILLFLTLRLLVFTSFVSFP